MTNRDTAHFEALPATAELFDDVAAVADTTSKPGGATRWPMRLDLTTTTGR